MSNVLQLFGQMRPYRIALDRATKAFHQMELALEADPKQLEILNDESLSELIDSVSGWVRFDKSSAQKSANIYRGLISIIEISVSAQRAGFLGKNIVDLWMRILKRKMDNPIDETMLASATRYLDLARRKPVYLNQFGSQALKIYDDRVLRKAAEAELRKEKGRKAVLQVGSGQPPTALPMQDSGQQISNLSTHANPKQSDVVQTIPPLAVTNSPSQRATLPVGRVMTVADIVRRRAQLAAQKNG